MQLRDAKTSELIAEGSTEEIAVAVQAFDAADVLFDGAGAVDGGGKSLFRPGEFRKAHADELAAVEARLAETPDTDEPTRAQLREAVRERKQKIARGRELQATAQTRMQEARARVKP